MGQRILSDRNANRYFHCRESHYCIMEEKEKKERTVIHLYIKENDTHHYFGSIANVFEYFSPDILGISYGSLRNYGLSNEKTFQNSKCIIRKGTLLSKSGNRGKK